MEMSRQLAGDARSRSFQLESKPKMTLEAAVNQEGEQRDKGVLGAADSRSLEPSRAESCPGPSASPVLTAQHIAWRLRLPESPV